MYPNNKEKFLKNKRSNNQKKYNYSFKEILYQPELLLQLLQSSLNEQKNFINFIKNNFAGFPNIKSTKYIKQIFYILPILINQLDLPFSSLLLEENELLQLFLEIYTTSYNEFSQYISSLFKNIYILFDIIEENLFENPMEDWKDILFDLEIIDENEKYLTNNGFTSVQTMFINLNNLFDNWIMQRNMENNIEEENLQNFDEFLKIYTDELILMQDDECMTPAILEYFEEMILKIKNFRNEKFIDGYKYINNNLSLEDQFSKININEDYEIPQINKIKNNIKKPNIKEIISELKKIPLHKRTYFYKNEKVVEDENLMIEYKDYYFPFGENQISELKRQICGFINSSGGRLYIGITDQKNIKGIALNNNYLNSFQNLLFSIIDDFSPKISDGKIKIYYIPIKNIETDKYIDNLYVVKLIIYPGDPKILYSLSKKGFYSSIRLQGQCANLTAEEIHKNIIEKHKNNNIANINKDKDFDDPSPEVIDNINNMNFEDEDDENQINLNQSEMIYLSNRNKKRKRRRNKKKKEKIISVKIYNIDENIFVKDLKNIFKNSGCFSMNFFQKRNGKSRGFGFLYFNDDNIANYFIQNCTDTKLGNKILKFRKDYFN